VPAKTTADSGAPAIEPTSSDASPVPASAEPAARPGDPVVPELPTTLAQTGLSEGAVLGLVLKFLYSGNRTGRELADETKISYVILESIINPARVEQLIEIKGAAGAGTAGYTYALTDRGRDRAKQYFEVNGYVGPAPVPLDQYVSYLRALARQNQVIDR